MNIPETIHINDARRIIYHSQQLTPKKKSETVNKINLYKIIEKLSYLQIDTISVVERSHHHILWSRMPGYKKEMLDELLEKDKLIFEYWSHAAAFLPMSDYKFSLIRKRSFAKKNKTWRSDYKKLVKYVLDRIKSEGPLQSRDFEDKKTGDSGWWNWKPSKDALDYLFHTGELMISKRKGFQKVYDLTERVLPDFADTNIPSESEFYKYLINRSVNSNGITRKNEILYLRRVDKRKFDIALKELLEEKIIAKISVAGIDNDFFYTSKENLEILSLKRPVKIINILSPFDNFIIQRKRLKELFDFDYQIECYVPEAKRKYGYFCLPVMHGDKFIGRIDAKAFRDKNTFVIKNQYFENDAELKLEMNRKYLNKITEFAKFNNCKKVEGI
jgi:uncharacterized protein YcaQ